MGLSPVGKRETPKHRVTGFDMKQQESLLPLLRGKSCTMPYAVEFQSCRIGCASVHAPSANRKRCSLLYVHFMELKCQKQGLLSIPDAVPTPRKGSVGVAVGVRKG